MESIHAARWQAWLTAVQALLIGQRLGLSALGRRLPRKLFAKHAIKCLERKAALSVSGQCLTSHSWGELRVCPPSGHAADIRSDRAASDCQSSADSRFLSCI